MIARQRIRRGVVGVVWGGGGNRITYRDSEISTGTDTDTGAVNAGDIVKVSISNSVSVSDSVILSFSDSVVIGVGFTGSVTVQDSVCIRCRDRL